MTIKLKNIHPGEVLFEEFLLPMMISQNMLARDIGVSPRRINEIVHGKRAVTADTDLRFSKALGTSEGFWLGLQADYDLEEKKISISAQLDKIQKLVNLDISFVQNNLC
jgi:antitoxin HigA-1